MDGLLEVQNINGGVGQKADGELDEMALSPGTAKACLRSGIVRKCCIVDFSIRMNRKRQDSLRIHGFVFTGCLNAELLDLKTYMYDCKRIIQNTDAEPRRE